MYDNFQWDTEVEDLIRKRRTLPYYWHWYFPDCTIKVTADDDLINQKRGIDLMVNDKYVDEKCSTYKFVNLQKEPPTWMVEILDGHKDGWFIDETKVTDLYLHVQIQEWDGPMKGEYPVKINPLKYIAHINKMWFMLQSRWDLTQLIVDMTGFTPEKLREYAKNEVTVLRKRYYLNSKKQMWLVKTEHGNQYPILLVIPIEHHKRISYIETVDIKERIQCRTRKNLLAM